MMIVLAFVMFYAGVWIGRASERLKQQGKLPKSPQKFTPPKDFNDLSLKQKAKADLWPLLSRIHLNGFDIADGPDKYSISILNKNSKVVAHFWPTDQRWVLVGCRIIGNGLAGMFLYLGSEK